MHEIIAGTEGWEGAVDAVAGIRLGFFPSSSWPCIIYVGTNAATALCFYKVIPHRKEPNSINTLDLFKN